jgi:class 3 adenylate cyclase
MSDLLATFEAPEQDAELLDRIAAYRPDRVTVLARDVDAALLDEDSSAAAALRDRLASLMAAIERETGATVVGLAGDRSQLIGWRFDRELTPRVAVPA